ncbi:MAG TPA: DNA repair protein RecO [Anaerolineae bacterium]|nr:DNA repair protein RecO [Anaerolineae bacterium]HOR00789.1 DNA repair protein RecO [Anaerolineae bacterium]HPL28124.1 DNA repair protein RecO [Anaerolineae bacterium]
MDRERLYRTEGIVLKRSDFGEADRLLVLFTPGVGKLRVLAKGVRKVPSRKAGHVEPFMRTRFLLARGRNLDIVTQAETVEAYQGLRESLVPATYAYYLVELVDAFAEEGEENAALYDLLAHALGRLAAGDAPALLARFFEVRLLGLVGYRPELQRCVACGVTHEPAAVFLSANEGGMRCPRCGQAAGGALEVSLGAFKVLRYLQSQEYAAVRALQLRPETAREVERVLRRYLTFVLERNLKSLSFLSLVQAGQSP